MGIRLPLLRAADARNPALWRTPVGLALIGAFLLPVTVLATVSVISVVQRKEIRALLSVETYGSIADLVSTKLSEGMEGWERELLAEIEGQEWDAAALIPRVQKAERAFPELRPIVVMDPDGAVVYPLRPRLENPSLDPAPTTVHAGSDFEWLLESAENKELEYGDLPRAEDLFLRAAEAATTSHQKVRALTGLARVRMKRDEPASAADLYLEIMELADPFDPAQTRYAAMARARRGDALAAAGATDDACAALLETIEFLQRHRFNIDRDLYRFYRRESELQLRDHELGPAQKKQLERAREAEPELDEIDASLDLLLRQMPQLAAVGSSDWLGAQPAVGATDAPRPDGEPELAAGWRIRYLNLQEDTRGATVVSIHEGSGWQVARRWRPGSVKKVIYWLMDLEGPWQEAGVALLDPDGHAVYRSTEEVPKQTVPSRIALSALPGWRVVAFPREGSLDQVAAQDVVDYAVLLSAAFLAVVGALVLATRTVSRQMALAQARSDFVSNVSHELKTPLALIRMFAENLRAGWVPEPKKSEYYGVMLGEAERLSGVIENVLDFSRIESGRREYEFRLTDLSELTAEIVDRYRYSFESAQITLEIDVPETPVTARIDREAIGQVVVNLLSNAAKYIGDPPRRVTLTLAEVAGAVHLTVSDTGVGMAPDDVERIFTPFCRLNQAGSRAVAGSGIGLTIVRHIVEAHGGHVDVESDVGTGSIFTVVLPPNPEPESNSPTPESSS